MYDRIWWEFFPLVGGGRVFAIFFPVVVGGVVCIHWGVGVILSFYFYFFGSFFIPVRIGFISVCASFTPEPQYSFVVAYLYAGACDMPPSHLLKLKERKKRKKKHGNV